MTNRYLTRSQFQNMHGMAASTLTDRIKPGDRLHDAFSVWPNSGTQKKTFDTKHPDLITWLSEWQAKREKRGTATKVKKLNPLDPDPEPAPAPAPAPATKAKPKRKTKPKPEQPPADPQLELNQFITDEDMKMLQLTPSAVNRMTVNKFFLMFGSAQSLKDWINSVHKSLQAEKLDIEIQKMRGDLIDIQYLKVVMSHIDGLQTTLLTSAVKNIVTQVTGMAKSQQPSAKIEKHVAEILSNNIKFAKTQTEKAVKNVAA